MENSQMKCLSLEQFGQPLAFKQVDIPQPGQGEVLIKVEASPINPSDLLFLAGKYATLGFVPPYIPGFEGSGLVIKSGGGQEADYLLNKRVAFFRCRGAYAQYTISNSQTCLIIDDDITFNQAASSFINPLTVVGMLETVKEAKVKTVVHSAAASALGRMMVRYFKNNGIEVINIVRRQDQVEILKKEGATIILNQNDQDFYPQLKKLTTDLNAKIFFDAIAGSFTGEILSQMPNNSTAYVYGLLSGENSSVSPTELIFRDQSVKGFSLNTWLQSITPELKRQSLEKLQKLIKTDLKSEISKEYPLQDGQQAIEYYSKNMSSGKVLIKPQY
ncbi:zinc-binding dehydrogenase family oxidoreductase (macronuclear) [Tetrahymena thermophila SB210]|uniref:Zinc-binding dehydrogenase family oxidoreductase n=1 Tax=Tetrahymena thermophila (strain SB210) TaxID=312017 RepID=I7M7B2_TETTS|nr:zinc-binding dehydrogenase family oxidoreductase [Tetrahymena thermophila SB210]EAR90902.2 zinc-binding dehydrogenase family oxidoreductase [Tetrahymena thermophila SB210]|eukprot:XP_001011147.2 zinc-binding dehydrogenase family oxidoreductase [Tetrahymena thermophila SB210]